ncbi:hypothetical protein M9H77_17103 [Catharanthus roseus]|uniref:Uncharacterized protein n=1 Tax=Catharanthus roseus TaxID=4058 RepID=A0ACC0B3L8_CATRO|nr:hypothetical protein M9H77_17103 [Catharanthus roseus]
MEVFRFLEFDPCPYVTKAYEGWWKMISQCFVASWTEVLKIALSSSIQAANDLSSPHTMEMSKRRPSFITDVLLVKQRNPPTNIGDSHIEVLVSGSIKSGRDITYYIKYMENLTKSQLTVISPQEILNALNKYFSSSHFPDTEEEQQELLDATLEVANKKLGEINAVTKMQIQLDNISKQDRQASDIKAQIAELVKELKEAKASSDQSSSYVRELIDVCVRVTQETQLYKIKFDELSIGRSCSINDKEAAQEMYEDVIVG